MQTYKRVESAGGFHRTISLTVTDTNVTMTYRHSAMGGRDDDYTMFGTVVHRGGANYMLVELCSFRDNHEANHDDEPSKGSPIRAYLDLYVFAEPQVSDDTTGLTEIHCANTPQVPASFDCVMYKNLAILWEPLLDSDEAAKILDSVDGVKLVSDGHTDTCGWSWELNKETNKIGRVFEK